MDRIGGGETRLNNQTIGARTGGVHIAAVKNRRAQSRGDFKAEGVEVSEIGRFGCRADSRGLDGDCQGLLFFKSLGDGVTGRQGDVDDRFTALDGVLDRVQGAHICAHV